MFLSQCLKERNGDLKAASADVNGRLNADKIVGYTILIDSHMKEAHAHHVTNLCCVLL